MEVVEHEHYWIGLSGVPNERGDAFVQPQPFGLGLQRRRLGDVREPLPNLRHQLRDFRRAVAQLAPQLAVRTPSHVLLERLDERPVWHRHFTLKAAPGQHLGAAQAGVDAELLGQARLTDARLAHEHRQRALPG